MKTVALRLTCFLGVIFLKSALLAQYSEVVDEIQFDKYRINVVFYDPYKNLVNGRPEFDNMKSEEQGEAWDEYLVNNVLYDFQLINGKDTIKHYVLRGIPTRRIEKLNLVRNDIFQVDIVNHVSSVSYYQQSDYQNEITLTTRKLDFYGTVFEDMEPVKAMIKADKKGFVYDLFGRARFGIPYTIVKNAAMEIFSYDLRGEFPASMVEKDKKLYNNPFFDYQVCINKYYQVDRIEKIYFLRYDLKGEIQDESPRIKITEDIQSRMNDTSEILGVTSFPWFKVSDAAVLVSETDTSKVYRIETNNYAAIDKHLKDIRISKDLGGNILSIQAITLIRSVSGNIVRRENIIIYFRKFDNCTLPGLILTSNIKDKDFEKPNSIIELDYLFYRQY